ncbi:MAG: right-handed parallel beta-helix repeat-containing protein [Phycisphaerae bacterium]
MDVLRRNQNRTATFTRIWLPVLAIAMVIVPACGLTRGRTVSQRGPESNPERETSSRRQRTDGGGSSRRNEPVDAGTNNGRVTEIAQSDFNATDSTSVLQRAINSDADTVVVPYTGRPWIVRPLNLRSNLRLILEPGVVLEAKRGAYKGKYDSVLLAKNMSNISILGYGASIRMHRDDYKGSGYEKAEWRHGICLQGAVDVEIHGLHVAETGGDGLYIGPTWDSARNECRNVEVTDCHFDKNYRQGITVVAGTNIRIENCKMTGTAGIAPQAGIDLEPSHPRDNMVAILVKNCVAEGNAGSGILANLTRLSNKSKPVSIRVENFLVRDSVQPGIRAILREDFGAEGYLDFVNCTVETTRYAGAVVIWDPGTKIRLSFEDCRWSNVARRSGEPPFHIELPNKNPGQRGSTIEFKNVRIFDDKNREPIRLTGKGEKLFRNVKGEITVRGNRSSVRELSEMPNLKVKSK